MTVRRSPILLVIVVLGLLFSLLHIAPMYVTKAPTTVTVVIPEGSSLASSEHNNFEPDEITVVIGVNNTVSWINMDKTASSIVAGDDTDPLFAEAARVVQGDAKAANFLGPGESFEFTFTKTGIFSYYSVPHPHKHGLVVVLPRNWNDGYFTAQSPRISQHSAIQVVDEYLRERVNNFEGIELYPAYRTEDDPCSGARRYLEPDAFFRQGCKLPLWYYHPTMTGYSLVSYGEGTPAEIAGHCIGPHCLRFSQEVKETLAGKLVYLVDTAWLFRDEDGNTSSLPSGFLVDAITGKMLHTNFYCASVDIHDLCK